MPTGDPPQFTTSNNTATWSPYVIQTVGDSVVYALKTGSSYGTIKKESEVKKMTRGAYLAWVFDTETDELVWSSDRPFVANDEDSAEKKVIQMAGAKLVKDLDKYAFGVLEVVTLPPKKEIQEVKVIREER